MSKSRAIFILVIFFAMFLDASEDPLQWQKRLSPHCPEYEKVPKSTTFNVCNQYYVGRTTNFRIEQTAIGEMSEGYADGVVQLLDINNTLIWEKDCPITDFYNVVYTTSDFGITCSIGKTIYQEADHINWIDISGDTLQTHIYNDNLVYTIIPINSSKKWFVIKESPSGIEGNVNAKVLVFNAEGKFENEIDLAHKKKTSYKFNMDRRSLFIGATSYLNSLSEEAVYEISFDGFLVNSFAGSKLGSNFSTQFTDDNRYYLNSKGYYIDLETSKTGRFYNADCVVGTNDKTGLILALIGNIVEVVDFNSKTIIFRKSFLEPPIQLKFSDDGKNFSFKVYNRLEVYEKKEIDYSMSINDELAEKHDKPNAFNSSNQKEGEWIFYLNGSFKPTKTKALARYYRVAEYRNGKPVGIVRDYFLNGTLQFEGMLISEFPSVYHGEIKIYSNDGKLKSKRIYSVGKRLDNKFEKFKEIRQ